MLLIGAVFGLLAGTLIEEFNMQPFIATLSTMFLARGLASIISTDSLTFPQGNDFSFISNEIKIIDNPKISNDLSFNVGVIIALVVVVFGYVLGSVLGSLVRSILDPLTSDFGVPAEWTTIVIGLMILVFVVLQRAVMAVGGDKK